MYIIIAKNVFFFSNLVHSIEFDYYCTRDTFYIIHAEHNDYFTSCTRFSLVFIYKYDLKLSHFSPSVDCSTCQKRPAL